MIICQLNVKRIAIFPLEADPVLIVHPNTVLSRSVTLQLLQSIIGRSHQIHQTTDTMKNSQFPQRHSRDAGPSP
jgi:hypothetical protein